MTLYGCHILPVIFSDQSKQIDNNRFTDFPGVLAFGFISRQTFFLLEYYIDTDKLVFFWSQIDLFFKATGI